MKTNEQASFIKGFIDCLLWSSLLDDDSPADECGCPLSEASIKTIEEECLEFISENSGLLAAYKTHIVANEWDEWERAGHDFALTRNHHGAGFWDRDYKQGFEYIGEQLTKASHEWEEMAVYLSDNNEIELF